jgi:hypothetical protein
MEGIGRLAGGIARLPNLLTVIGGRSTSAQQAPADHAMRRDLSSSSRPGNALP